MRSLGFQTTFTIKRGGWVSETNLDTGSTLYFRTPELLGRLEAKRKQLNAEKIT